MLSSTNKRTLCFDFSSTISGSGQISPLFMYTPSTTKNFRTTFPFLGFWQRNLNNQVPYNITNNIRKCLITLSSFDCWASNSRSKSFMSLCLKNRTSLREASSPFCTAKFTPSSLLNKKKNNYCYVFFCCFNLILVNKLHTRKYDVASLCIRRNSTGNCWKSVRVYERFLQFHKLS